MGRRIVGGGERQAGRGNRAGVGVAGRKRQDDIRRGLRAQPDGESCRSPLVGGGETGGVDSYAGRQVVDVQHGDVAGINAIVPGIRAGGRSEHNRVGDAAAGDRVVPAGNRHGLRYVPVVGGKGQRALVNGALARVARTDVEDYIRRGRKIQHDREGSGAAALRRQKIVGGRHGDPWHRRGNINEIERRVRVARPIIDRLQATGWGVARLHYPPGPVGRGLVADDVVEVVIAAAFGRDNQNPVGWPAANNLEKVGAGASEIHGELRRIAAVRVNRTVPVDPAGHEVGGVFGDEDEGDGILFVVAGGSR